MVVPGQDRERSGSASGSRSGSGGSSADHGVDVERGVGERGRDDLGLAGGPTLASAYGMVENMTML